MIKSLQEHLAFIQLQSGNNPLLEGLMSLTLKRLKKTFPQVWIRNSYYFNAHHPLASDIDLTYIGQIEIAKKIFKKTLRNKLLGELNFYPDKITDDLLFLINPYELARDPLLEKKFPKREKTEIQRQVFLSRHIIGDSYWLKRNPVIRQKKWEYLLTIMEASIRSLSLEDLLAHTLHPEALRFYLDSKEQNLFNHFKNSSHRFLFPHKHIWEADDHASLLNLSSSEKEFFIEQVKWEFWGIGTQLHWINLPISYEFLERLKKTVIHIGVDQSTLKSFENILAFIQEQLATNR